MKLEAHFPIPDKKLIRLLEDRNPVVWVTLGKPNFWNKLFSGMVGEKDEACVIFKIDKSRVRKPNGLFKIIFSTWIFGKSQCVIDGDVDLNKDAEDVRFIFKSE